MREITNDDLLLLLNEANSKRSFFWDHYEELAGRKACYTLYGPMTHGLGALVPCMLTHNGERKLTKSTKRMNYAIYEMDQNFKVIRTTHIRDYTRVDCTYHHFEIDGVTYACEFYADKKQWTGEKICALRYENGKPVYFASCNGHYILAFFMEYVSSKKMMVTTRSLSYQFKSSIHGLVPDWNAPPNTPHALSTMSYREEPVPNIDFSRYFAE